MRPLALVQRSADHGAMELRDLRAFVALADEKHFAAAAQVLGLSQPALSARIRHLEQTLGLRLVQRAARFEGLTPEGQKLLPWARRVLAEALALTDVAADVRHHITRDAVIGVVPSALPFAARFVARLLERQPALHVEIRSMTAQAIAADLGAFRIDGGLTYVDGPVPPGLQCAPLYDERYWLLVPSELAQAVPAEPSWRDLAGLPMALLSPDMRFRQIVDANVAAAGAALTPKMTSNSFEAVLAAARVARCATILPAAWAEATEPGDFVLHPLPLEAARPRVGLLVRNQEPSPPLTLALLATARTVARSTP